VCDASNNAVPISRFAGVYVNPGYYGNLTICAWPSEPDTLCEEVLSDYGLIDPEFESQKATTLYGYWGRMFVTHVKLEQVDSTTFDAKADALYTKGCGQDASPFFVRQNREGGGLAEFGMRGDEVVGLGAWGLAAGPSERVPGKPKESSEVWFHKIE